MPHDLRDLTSPAGWLRRARSNLARAKAGRPAPEILYEDLCFDAQQSVEKAIKAVLISKGVPFPKTHAIAELLTLLAPHIQVPDDIRSASALTRYAVDTRHPGLSEPVTEQEYAQAVKAAERVVRWAEQQIVAGPESPPASSRR
jgi:HEPN domain-containing protein